MADRPHSFIVRVWYEESSGEEDVRARRGYIEHVGTKRHLYFADTAEILRFIDRQVFQRDAGRGAETALPPEE